MSVKENLLEVLKEIPQGVELVAVSKFHPADMIMEAYEAGQRVGCRSFLKRRSVSPLTLNGTS